MKGKRKICNNQNKGVFLQSRHSGHHEEIIDIDLSFHSEYITLIDRGILPLLNSIEVELEYYFSCLFGTYSINKYFCIKIEKKELIWIQMF